jgi:hypothetical protein
LNEGEILLPEDKLPNNTLNDIPLEEIKKKNKKNEKFERKVRLNKQIIEENKSKEEEETFMKDREERDILNKRFKKITKENEKYYEDDENSSLSVDMTDKINNAGKIDIDNDLNNSNKRHSNEKLVKNKFYNIKIDYSFESINIIPVFDLNITKEKINSFENEIMIRNEEEEKEFSSPKRDNDESSYSQHEIKFIEDKEKIFFVEEFEIQKNIVFSVIDRDYTLEQLPVIEEEKEEMISIESKVNEFFIERNKTNEKKVFDFNQIKSEKILSNNFSIVGGQIFENNQKIKSKK